MNKILNINLGGYALTIDDDAFEYLEAYLQSIRRRFSENEGRDEIIHDIESRLGELISDDMRGRSIVMMPDVEAALRVMGKPEDFGADPIDNKRNMSGSRGGAFGSPGSGSTAVRTGKRLFRDEDDAIVGGVCSGLSAYFGIADPVWMRLIFVLVSFISLGFWAPAYILLWILVPAAKSSADRLAMRGQPINVDNIAKEIETGFDRVSSRVSELGDEAKKKSGEGGRSFGNAVAGGVSVLGRIFGFFVQFLAKFGVFIAIIVGIALFIALAVSWIAGIWSVFHSAPYLEYFSPFSSGTTYFGLANIFFLLTIPLLGLCLMFSRVLFKTRAPAWLRTGLGLFWGVNVFVFFGLATFGVKSYRQGATATKNLDLGGIGSDTLRVGRLGNATQIEYSFDEWDGDRFWWWDDGPVRINGEKLTLPSGVDIRVRRSEDGQFRVVQTIRARGGNSREAAVNAEQIDYQLQLNGNRLTVPMELSLNKGQHWRGQHVRLTIEMPAGKYVVFDEGIHRHAAADMDEYSDDTHKNYISRSPNRVFRMSNDGLVCSDCPRWGDRDYEEDRHFDDFILEGNFTTEIQKGDRFSIQVDGSAADKALLKSIRTGQKLTLTTEEKPLSGPIRVTIKTPVFTTLYARNTGDVTIRGFEEGRSSISARGNAKIRGYFDCQNLDISLNGNCTLDLTGQGDQMDIVLSEGANLDAASFRAHHARATASGGSKARLHMDGSVNLKSDAGSKIEVEGGAQVEDQKENQD